MLSSLMNRSESAVISELPLSGRLRCLGKAHKLLKLMCSTDL